MSGSSKKRLREGALSALKTPTIPPAPARLVPAESSKGGVGATSVAPAPRVQAPLEMSSDTEVIRAAVARAQAGDPEGLHTLYVRFAPDVLRYVASFVHDLHEAEDITQNVFAKLATVIHKYEARDVPFSAWIMRVARHAALDSMRAKRAIPTSDVQVETGEADQNMLSVDRGIALRQALEQLPEDQREVLVLRHIAGLSPGEVAAALERSEGSIKQLQHRAKRTLREHPIALHDLLLE